jgi:hypothetical protein
MRKVRKNKKMDNRNPKNTPTKQQKALKSNLKIKYIRLIIATNKRKNRKNRKNRKK